MSFELILSPKSYRQLKKMNIRLKDEIKEAILEIKKDPWHRGTIKVENYENIRRKRVGKYRILYAANKEKKEILIVKIEYRSETTYR